MAELHPPDRFTVSSVIESTAWQRLKVRVRRLFSARYRAATSLELSLQTNVSRLRMVLEDRESTIRDLRFQLEEERSRLKVRETEIAELAEVIARDRMRIQAETAIYARQVAEAKKP